MGNFFAELKRRHIMYRVARRLGCDEDKARFEKRLGKIAKAKPSATTKK